MIADKAKYPLDLGFQSDDFALDHAGNAWVMSNPSGGLIKIGLTGGAQETLAGGLPDPALTGATSAAFGRTDRDKNTLYIVTDGGQVDPNAAGVRGGKVLSLDTATL